MYSVYGVFLVCLVVLTRCNHHQDRFCQPYTYTCGPITPTPPSSYIAHIEAVDQLYNNTHYLQEFYHYERQVLALTDAHAHGYTHTIFYYEINTVVIVSTYNDTEDGVPRVECLTADISADTPWLSGGTTGTNHTVMALAPSQALLFGGNYKYSWVERFNERSIPCNRWDACIYTAHNGTLYVEYHWSDPNRTLDMFGYSSERPVTMTLFGYIYLPHNDPYPVELKTTYNYALFDDHPDWTTYDWVFEIPSNVYCDGLPDVLKRSDFNLAEAYSERVEIITQMSTEQHQEFVSTVKGWYDHDNQIDRNDFITNQNTVEYDIAGLTEITAIKDYRCGVEYIIDKALGNCTTILIANEDFSDSLVKVPRNFLFSQTQVTNLTYYGVKYVRGLPCDVWVTHLNFTRGNTTYRDSVLYELYLLQPGWKEDGGATHQPGTTQHAVPVLLRLQQDITNPLLPYVDDTIVYQENFFKYDDQSPSLNVYDITPCYTGHQHIRRFQVAFPRQNRYDFDLDPVRFTTTVQLYFAIDLLIVPLRIQHMLVEFQEDVGLLYCEFTLLDLPQVQGVRCEHAVGPPLDQVVDRLKYSMNDLVVILYDPSYDTPGHTKVIKPYNDSLRELFDDNCTSPDNYGLSHDSFDLSPDSFDLSPDSFDLSSDNYDLSRDNYKSKHTAGNEGTHTAGNEGTQTTTPAAPTNDTFATWLMSKMFRSIHGSSQLRAVSYLTSSSTPEAMYSPGAMAGMAIGMFFLGLLLGIGVMLYTLSKFGLAEGFEFIPLRSDHSRS